MLRKAAERTLDDLWRSIGRIIDTFTPTEYSSGHRSRLRLSLHGRWTHSLAPNLSGTRLCSGRQGRGRNSAFDAAAAELLLDQVNRKL
ncbi:hypothetical protein SAMN02927895_05370 [Belnapia rosea]|nr:hypothetical protein SAMN02927895_05370 [Belnapia rosea]